MKNLFLEFSIDLSAPAAEPLCAFYSQYKFYLTFNTNPQQDRVLLNAMKHGQKFQQTFYLILEAPICNRIRVLLNAIKHSSKFAMFSVIRILSVLYLQMYLHTICIQSVLFIGITNISAY